MSQSKQGAPSPGEPDQHNKHATTQKQFGPVQPAPDQTTSNQPFHPPNPVIRLLLPAAAGLLTTLLLGSVPGGVHLPRELRVMCGWVVFSGGYLLMTWLMMLRADSGWIRQLAQAEDNGRRVTQFLALVASLVSLLGVVAALSKATDLGKANNPLEYWLTGAAILSVSLSWMLIQTVYTLRYARLYYSEPEGGIEFDGADEPDYLDFAYLSFTLGMTYQVSDTNISQKIIRNTVLGHTLIAYVYGVVIIALSISVVSSLIS